MLHRDRHLLLWERWISGGRALRDRYDRDQWITSEQPQSGGGWMSSDTKSESGWIYRWILILRATLVLVWVLRWFSYKLLSSDRAQTGVVEGSVEVSHCESTHCVIQVSHLTESSYRVVSPWYTAISVAVYADKCCGLMSSEIVHVSFLWRGLTWGHVSVGATVARSDWCGWGLDKAP